MGYARFSPDMSEINEEKIKKFVSATGYVGIFDIEMIKAYGKYWFIEINYRNGQYGYTPTVGVLADVVGFWLNGRRRKQRI